MSTVTRYEQRLRCMLVRKQFTTRLEELQSVCHTRGRSCGLDACLYY